MVTGAAPAALAGGLRLAVAALTLLLPSGFRDRQRAEWTADLMTLPTGPVAIPVRRRPDPPRAARRRPPGRPVPRPDRRRPRPPAPCGAPARVLLAGLGWPVLSWLLLVPLPYFLFDIPGRIASTGGPSTRRASGRPACCSGCCCR